MFVAPSDVYMFWQAFEIFLKTTLYTSIMFLIPVKNNIYCKCCF